VIRTKILPERLQTAEAAIVPELQRAIAETGGEIAVVLHSSAYADAAGRPRGRHGPHAVRLIRGHPGTRRARRRALGDAWPEPHRGDALAAGRPLPSA
jgi:hypothetical protein